MNLILDILVSIYAAFAIIPIFTFIFVWMIAYFFIKDKKLSTRVSMDITTLFLIGSVSTLWNNLFVTKFGIWLILLVLLIAFGLIGGYQTKEKGQTDLFKVSKLVWRLSFVGLTALYVILLLAYVIKRLWLTT